MSNDAFESLVRGLDIGAPCEVPGHFGGPGAGVHDIGYATWFLKTTCPTCETRSEFMACSRVAAILLGPAWDDDLVLVCTCGIRCSPSAAKMKGVNID